MANQKESSFGSTVTISGILTSKQFETINNSVTDVFFLIPAEPINVIGTAEDSPTEIDVRQIQLMGNETMDLFNKNISGKKSESYW